MCHDAKKTKKIKRVRRLSPLNNILFKIGNIFSGERSPVQSLFMKQRSLEVGCYSKHTADAYCAVSCIVIIFAVQKVLSLYERSEISVYRVAYSCVQVVLVDYACVVLAFCISGKVIADLHCHVLYRAYLYSCVCGNFRAQCKPIDVLTYRELRELAYMGATVLHDEAIFPVRKEGIPINILNTNKPEDKGTLIVEGTCRKPKYIITGIAGKKDFASITIEKDMMNSEIGFGRKVLNVFDNVIN